MNNSHAYDINSFGGNPVLTVNVGISKSLQWRMRLGIALMALGARIATLGFNVERDEDSAA